MGKILIYLPISFFLIGMGCIMFTNSYDEIWITIRNVSFLLSVVTFVIASINIKKTGGGDHFGGGDHLSGDHLSGDE